ncbi:hypothetical protein SERLA73DRAFT_142748 [Serpula lacrymans var. lacrymans S7.3]|uniref:Uncharacterized protein n=2 Tax=Serpula lacrymans var. lacrymans TaxID=341189 RepID=F8Q8B6_SERL3|nr:uncharacterized protein SERLADRAFT_398967 [Serpula lacrymans var. lacrymans S7.9]EGN95804.1 hypothetical protein SERLA73DRAFT_142748 [Serpula lacrymans var. lacrymans S7.3]EGO21325.1 hypothetical protein SERLADRAFT_398967 [Serpula lacrymans var. lacrymans S7.9]
MTKRKPEALSTLVLHQSHPNFPLHANKFLYLETAPIHVCHKSELIWCSTTIAKSGAS